MELLAPDRVAVVFDGSRSWESRRVWIEQARDMAAPRAAQLESAAAALEAEGAALDRAIAAACDMALVREALTEAEGNRTRNPHHTLISSQRRLRVFACGIAAFAALAAQQLGVEAQQPFAAEIFGPLGRSSQPDDAHEVYPALHAAAGAAPPAPGIYAAKQNDSKYLLPRIPRAVTKSINLPHGSWVYF